MQNRCHCCVADMTNQTCSYCGFFEPVALDESGEQFIKSQAALHRAKVIASITDIAVISHKYTWKESASGFEKIKTEQIKIADGRECDNRIVWTRQEFGQLPDEKPLQLSLSYRTNGIEKQLVCELPRARCDDFWKVGVQIGHDLRLKVFLGREKQHTESKSLALSLG